MAVLTCTQIFLALGMLLSGSINTLSKKAQNDCSAKGLKDEHDKEVHKFDHPWFQTGLMFIGESLCLIGLYFYRRRERQQTAKRYQEVVNWNRDEPHSVIQQPRVFQWIFAFPTICDLFGTTLAGIGLLYVSASVWQMLRGSIIIFTGILSTIFLKRKLWPIHWIGIVVTMVGLVLVGLSSILRENHQGASRGQVILGIVLILAAQCVSATQMIVEEIFLKKRNFPALQVVGMEGVFGVFFMCVVVLPVVYYIPGDQHHNSYENSLDALVMIKNDYKLAIFSVLYICSISFYNFFGLSVTKSLTAVHRTLIDACRTIVVWLVDLFVYYAIRDKDFGEAFDKKYGIFQVDGFLFLLLGTALYNELLVIPPLMPKTQADLSPGQPQVQASDDQASDENEPLIKASDQSGSYTGVV